MTKNTPRIIEDILLDMQRLAPALEHKRRLYTLMLMGGITLIVTLIFGVVLLVLSASAVTLAVLVVIGLLPCYLFYRLMNHTYRKAVHKAFVDAICRRGNLEYSDLGFFEASEVAQHGILPQASKHSSGEGIKGTYHGVTFALQELSMKDGQVTSFWGIVARIYVKHSFEAHTVIIPKSWVGSYRIKYPNWSNVTPMAKKFEKYYETLSSDPIEAKAIMPPMFMERFMDAGQLPRDQWMSISFCAREIAIAYPRYRPLFVVPHLWQPVSADAMQRCIWEVESLFQVIDLLRTNPQIQTT